MALLASPDWMRKTLWYGTVPLVMLYEAGTQAKMGTWVRMIGWPTVALVAGVDVLAMAEAEAAGTSDEAKEASERDRSEAEAEATDEGTTTAGEEATAAAVVEKSEGAVELVPAAVVRDTTEREVAMAGTKYYLSREDW